MITRGEPGGAQVQVRDLVLGLHDAVHFEVCIGDDEWLAQQLRAAGVSVHIIDVLQREIDPARDLTALRALGKLVDRCEPHIVHTHSTKAGLLGRLAARSRRRPCVHTAHAWSFSDGLPRRRKALAVPPEVLVGRVTDHFIVVSAADRELALRYRVGRADQITVVHNGVQDLPDRADPASPETPVLTMVARLAPPKDHALLLEALSTLDLPFQLRVVGDGPDRADLEEQAATLGLGDRVEFLGVCDDVPVLLANSQLSVLISRQEGFPLAVLEAMRAGLPVIASDVGGIREAVEPDRTGLLVPRGDREALAEALARLLGDPEERARMGAAARSAYEARFTATHMLRQTAAVYAELAQDCGAPAPDPLPHPRGCA